MLWDIVHTFYFILFQTVDFAGQSEAVRAEINSAVENETNSKIKDLIPAGKCLWWAVLNTSSSPFYYRTYQGHCISQKIDYGKPMYNILV